MSSSNPATPAVEPPKPELTDAEKKAILREAVSYYIRTNPLPADTLKVCQDYIDQCDKEARDSAQQS